MGKNFTKTMSFDDFKTMQKETPISKFNSFIDASNKLMKVAQELNTVKNELVKEFLKKRDYLLFTYEHLPAVEDLKPSEVGEMMRNASYWTISKVGNENKVAISFFDDKGKSITTEGIPYSEFEEFISVEWD